jgi:hypothetical protein
MRFNGPIIECSAPLAVSHVKAATNLVKWRENSLNTALCILNVFFDPVPEYSQNVLSRQNHLNSACCILNVFSGPVPEYSQNFLSFGDKPKTAINFNLAMTKKNIPKKYDRASRDHLRLYS